MLVKKYEFCKSFTPLNIYNGTPGGRLNRDLRATLPINELKGNPPYEGCTILNLHRCILVVYLHFRHKIISIDFISYQCQSLH